MSSGCFRRWHPDSDAGAGEAGVPCRGSTGHPGHGVHGRPWAWGALKAVVSPRHPPGTRPIVFLSPVSPVQAMLDMVRPIPELEGTCKTGTRLEASVYKRRAWCPSRSSRSFRPSRAWCPSAACQSVFMGMTDFPRLYHAFSTTSPSSMHTCPPSPSSASPLPTLVWYRHATRALSRVPSPLSPLPSLCMRPLPSHRQDSPRGGRWGGGGGYPPWP